VSATYQRRTTKSVTRTLRIPDLGDPPTIVLPPVARVGVLGGSASFSVQASGTAPLTYLWSYNGTNALAWATGPTMVMTNLQAGQSGLYSVVVTNSLAAVTSAPVFLTLVAPATLSGPALVGGGPFRLSIYGRTGDRWRVLASSNLVDWVRMTDLTLTSPTGEYLDSGVANNPRRFFRLEALPSP
jgi:hypothetical protein